jgi:hypothetical protein
MGRWSRRDPLDNVLDNITNPYSYVQSSPTNSADPSGLAGLDLGPPPLPGEPNLADQIREYVNKKNWPSFLPTALRDKLRDDCDYYTVYGHGGRNTVSYQPAGSSVPRDLAADDAVKLIQEQPNFKKGSCILLLTCSPCGGKSQFNIAAAIAEKMKTDVAGATCTIETISQGGKISEIQMKRSPTDPQRTPQKPDEWIVERPPKPNPPTPRPK